MLRVCNGDIALRFELLQDDLYDHRAYDEDVCCFQERGKGLLKSNWTNSLVTLVPKLWRVEEQHLTY